jgi:hypothetical protein
MIRNRMAWPATLTVVVLVLSGCGGHQRKGPEAAAATGAMSGSFAETLPSGSASTGGADSYGLDAAGGTTSAAGSAGSGGAAGSGDAAKVPAMPSAAASSAAAGPAPAGGGSPPFDSGSQGDQNVTVGLRAGSVDDNARFADYLAYRNSFATLGQDVHEFDVTRRHVFTVTNQSGYPLLGARIVISNSGNSNSGDTVADLLTDSSGRALWFPQNFSANANSSFKAVVSKGGATAHVSIDPTSSVYQITLDAPATAAPVPLDIEFVVDATGSMGDEIAQLKASLSDIATRIDALPAKPDVRFALTIYRDRVDSFLTRTWNFTSDLAGFEKEIAGVTADGGGDDPEDVQQGLYDALHKPAWRTGAAAKLMVLIGDARPHLDYANDPDYITTAVDAARMGVKIESLAASGLDDTGEYIWRQLAEITQGQFLFLTYGPTGGPGDTTTHHVDGYTPMNLEDLVVRLVSQELSPLGARKPPAQQ